MDSVFAWAVVTIIGIIFVCKFISKMPADSKKDVYTSTEMKFITGRK